ncbi:S1C family serine protease [Streptomyces roseoverticillatus]|uniref:S1C family serine protease n=1 Tax=Streptomyces roseoverticillatus TaxID=66429 RepID=UPI0009962A94|nr:trypsin-like peptidase domain-containing protein [Streptomyces roseoverticillatus]
MSTENEGAAGAPAEGVPDVPGGSSMEKGAEAAPVAGGQEPGKAAQAVPPAAAAAPAPSAAEAPARPAPAAAPAPPVAPAHAPEQPVAPPQPEYAHAGAPQTGAQGQAGAQGQTGVQGHPGGWYDGQTQQHPSPPAPPPAQPYPYGAPAGGGPVGPTGVWAGGPDPYAPAPRKRGGGLVAMVLAATLVAGGIGGGIGYWAASRDDSGSSTTVSSSGDPKTESRTPGSVADIAGKALPSVVTIEAQSGGGEGGTGTGFVYDKQGHILTNNHVVASAAQGGGKLMATFSDGKQYDAEVVGRAQGYDVAVIKLKNPSGAKLNPIPLGDSDRAAVGDATIAIGAPFGLSGTVTTGIVSAKKRPVASSDGGGMGKASYMSALQTDASINPGNSGGPLLNAQGAVIGINSAIQSANNGGGFGGAQQQAGSIGLGFAIPINQARNVADQLIRTGQPVYPVISASVNMKDAGAGAKIAPTGDNNSPAVTPGGPADKAGLKPGDVITKLDDTAIDSGPTLISEIWTHKPGDKVTVTYTRDGKQSTAQITLGERKGDS